MIDKQFFKSMHDEYCTQHQIIEDWYKSPTDDELVSLYESMLSSIEANGIVKFARAVEELIRTKNEL